MLTVTYTDLNSSSLLYIHGVSGGKNEIDTQIASKRNDWDTITAIQMGTFLLFVCGIFFAILMYCKTCSRIYRGTVVRHSVQNVNACQNNNDDSIDSRSPNPYSFYERADRPPPYYEVCDAPPLYECPINRVSMLDAPPVYPETPKAPERKVPDLITNHI